MSGGRLTSLILFAISLLLLMAGLIFFITTVGFLQTAVRTNGVVVQMDNTTTNNGTTYYPVIRFQESDGASLQFESNVGSNPPIYSVNQNVTVLYNPQKPSDYRIDDFISLWLTPIIFGFIGVVFLIISAALFFTIGKSGGVLMRSQNTFVITNSTNNLNNSTWTSGGSDVGWGSNNSSDNNSNNNNSWTSGGGSNNW